MYKITTPNDLPVFIILPPKTGTRSIERAIKRELNAERIGSRHDVDVRQLIGAAAVAATIRHPCDVLVSWYHYSVLGKKSGRRFGDFLDRVFRDDSGMQGRYLRYSTLPGAEHAKHFICYEDGLENSLNIFLWSHGLPKVSLEHLGASINRRPWREYYSRRLLRIVKDKFGQDFERYEYAI